MVNYDLKHKLHDNFLIAGIDEAGRGPLAGPVVVASVIMPLESECIIESVNDSKKLSPKLRELLYKKIMSAAISYHIEVIDNVVIDEINILNATKLGMKNCIENLSVVPDVVLIDAVRIEADVSTVSIIKGDELSYNIACASILAKVYRDRLMCEFDKLYPKYQFAKHKGYGTKLHIETLKQVGKCDIHRQSFIKKIVG